MSRRIFTFWLTCMSLAASGQYFPFPTENAIWEGSFIGIVGTPFKEYYVICGDTTFNDAMTYRKIYQVGLDTGGNVTYQAFVSGIAEEIGQKLIWANNGGGAYLLYDFNLNEGDKFPVNAQDTLIVETIGFTNVGGEMRRTIFFKHNPEFPQEFWIEGIGSNFNLLTRGINLEIIADYLPYLECFHQNNEVLINLFPGESVCHPGFHTTIDCGISTSDQNVIKEENVFELFPNPANAYVRLVLKKDGKTGFDLRIYDALGRLVMISPIYAYSTEVSLSQLAPGMYHCNLFDSENKTQSEFKKLIIQR